VFIFKSQRWSKDHFLLPRISSVTRFLPHFVQKMAKETQKIQPFPSLAD